MRIIKDRTKQMRRYHEDYGYLRRVKLYTRNRLNVVSNKIYLLKEWVRKILKRRVLTTKLGNKYKQAMKLAYIIGSGVYKMRGRNRGQKVDKSHRAKMFMKNFLMIKLFRTIYRNMKIRHLKKMYKKCKGSIIKMHQMLETRIDVLLVRSGLAIDLDQARFLLNMKVVEIDRRIVKSMSRNVKPGELITIKEGGLRTEVIASKFMKLKDQAKWELKLKTKCKLEKNYRLPSAQLYFIMVKQKIKIKTDRPKVPQYLETSFPLYATTLLYLPKTNEITYSTMIETKAVHLFLTGIPLIRRIGK